MRGRGQRDLHVGARPQLAIRIRQCHLDLQRAGRHVDRAGDVRDRAVKRLAGQFRLRHGDLLAVLHVLRIRLRKRVKQRVRLGEREERAARAARCCPAAAPLLAPLPASIRSPTSTLRCVTTPENGATIRLNDSSWRRRRTFASAAARFATSWL